MTSQQLMKMILEESEEISNKIKRLEQLSAQIEQSNQLYLNELKRTEIKVDRSGVDQSIDTFRNVVEHANKSLERKQKGFNWVLYSVVFCAISLASLFFAFRFGFQAKSEIRNEFYNELNRENRILLKEDAVFIQKFRKWKWKNPKDSKKLMIEVEKMNER